ASITLTAAQTGSASLSVAANNTNQNIANFTLKNNSSDSVKVNSITFQQGSFLAQSFINLKLMSGTTQLGNLAVGSAINNEYVFVISNGLVIAPQTTVYLNVFGDALNSPAF